MADQSDIDGLRDLLAQLPQELYDQIFNGIFTATPATRNLYTGEGISSNLLQVDRASRDVYAKSYYGPGNTFFFGPEDPFTSYTMLSWTYTLSATHLNMVDHISLIYEDGEEEIDWPRRNGLERREPQRVIDDHHFIGHVRSICSWKSTPRIEGRLRVNEGLRSPTYVFGATRTKSFLERTHVLDFATGFRESGTLDF